MIGITEMELNHLPDELFHVLFGYLDMSTLLTTCALVCKRWRELIHQMRIQELHFGAPFSVYFVYSTFTFWSCPSVPKDPRYLVRTYKRIFFDFSFIKMFENLKRLKLNWSLSSEFDFDKLNQFSALEELDVSISFREPTEKTLNLPRLRVLILTLEINFQSKLTVDCPVKVLSIYYRYVGENVVPQSGFVLVYPDLLEKVIFAGKASPLNLPECKNVRYCREYLCLDANLFVPQSEVFAADHLETFPNLQELHYQVYLYSTVKREREAEEMWNTVRSRISGALQKKRQQNLQVKIFFQGIQIEGERFLESLDLKNDLSTLHAQHYDLLATNLTHYDRLNYSSLEKHFGESLPTDLFSKFNRLNLVFATEGIKHLDKFATFLSQCKYLIHLDVELDWLNQDFCDQLHVNCFFLQKLVFRDRKKEESNEGDQGDLANVVDRQLVINDDLPFKKINFDFLAKQKNLVSLVVGKFDMEPALRCLQINPKLSELSFKYFTGSVSIKRLKNNFYTLDASDYGSSNRHATSIVSNQLSIDELALDLEFFQKKIDKELALTSNN